MCNRDCRASLDSALAALHACLDHGVKPRCSFAAAFGGVIPGLRCAPAGEGQEDRERAMVITWLKRAIAQGASLALCSLRCAVINAALPGNLVVFLESISRRLTEKLVSSYAPHSLLRDSEAVLLLTGTLTGICTSVPVKAAAAASVASSPSPSSSPSIEAGATGGAFTIGDARIRLMQAEAAKVSYGAVDVM